MKKVLKVMGIMGLTLMLMLGKTEVRARVVPLDSGWDSSYDSGGSWDSGSDWSSSDSWNSGSSSYSGGSDMSLGEFVIVLVVMIIIIAVSVQASKKGKLGNSSNFASMSSSYRGLTDEEIKNIDSSIDSKEMNKIVSDIYVKVQKAWMDFDFDDLRKYTTDELFNMYNSQLKVLKAKKQKNIMENITFVTGRIIDIDISNGVEKVKMFVTFELKDYVVDSNNNVVRGNKNITNSIDYLITLNRNMEKEKLEKCPSCGAPIKDIETGGKCPYCDSVIVNNNKEFVMSKKECVGQRRK